MEEHNPSAWHVRVIAIALALAGLGIATYLALYQVGVVHTVWEPFFGDGSERVLHSVVARLLPVPDATLGMLAYLVDIVLGSIGSADRWRSKPWIVVVYALVIMAFACVAIALLLVQAFVVHASCTLCLASAFISIVLVIPAAAELRAAVGRLRAPSAEMHGHRLERCPHTRA
jgi:uncharacterized membrane protein